MHADAPSPTATGLVCHAIAWGYSGPTNEQQRDQAGVSPFHPPPCIRKNVFSCMAAKQCGSVACPEARKCLSTVVRYQIESDTYPASACRSSSSV